MVFIKNEKGAALPIALMTMLVVTLMGTALWQYSVTDTIQVARNKDSVQAHYLAKAGAEVGLGIIKEKLSTNSYSNASDLHDNGLVSVDPFTGNLDSAGTFNVYYTSIDTETIKILSTGTANSVSDTVSLTVKITNFPAFVPIPPNPDEWIAGASMEIRNNAETNTATIDGSKYLNNSVTLTSDRPHPIRYNQNHHAVFYASVLYFKNHIATGESLRVDKNDSELTLNTIYLLFEGKVEIEKQNASRYGRLHIKGSYPPNHPNAALPERGLSYSDLLAKVSGNTALETELNSLRLDTTNTSLYGLVNFGDGVYFNGSKVVNSGYYIFPSSGVSLHDAFSVGNLIPISEELFNGIFPSLGNAPWVQSVIWGKN